MSTLLELSSWTSFKSICIAAKNLNCQFDEQSDRYELYGPDANGITWRVSLLKTSPANSDQIDFETNYKSSFNGKIVLEQLDSDGAPMSRVKVVPSGWNFNYRMVDLKLSTVGSLVNNNAAGVAQTDVTLSLYDGSGVLIIDPANQGNCVKTVVDIEPVYDIYVAGGALRMDTQVTDNVYLNVIAVPDIPALYGGSKAFVQNVNLKYITNSIGLDVDGRAAKLLTYSATYHTNKFRFQFTHPAGYQMGVGILMEMYRQ